MNADWKEASIDKDIAIIARTLIGRSPVTVLAPLLCWFLSTALRIAVVLCVLRAIHGVWLTEPSQLVLASLPFLIELLALLSTPWPPFIVDENDSRGKSRRRAYLATRPAEQRNNTRANMYYMLRPGPITLIVDITALTALRVGFSTEIKITLLGAFGISAVAWLVTWRILRRIGPEYGPPPEAAHHTHKSPPPKPQDTSRTEGMQADAPEDGW